MTLQELVSVDAARIAATTNFLGELYHRIDWNIVGPILGGLLLFTIYAIKFPEVTRAIFGITYLAYLRERKRMRMEEQLRQRELVADYVTDALETAYVNNEISFDDKQMLYRRIGRLGFPDLIKRGATTLKQEIKERLANPKLYSRERDGSVKEVPFPDTSAIVIRIL